MIRRRKVSPVEVVDAFLRQIESCNGELNAIVTLAPDARDRALEAEQHLRSGSIYGPLHGVPVTIKDTIETAGLRTTAGSKVLKDNIPATDAPAVAALKAAGAIILGKSNVPEMAMTYESDNPLFGRTSNPHDQKRTSGGSSGGEAAAIASGMSPLGLGSDLSGSIRIPANFCGIFGLKPTPGVIANAGHIPSAETSLSTGATFGPMARCARDLRLMLDCIGNPSRLDSEEISPDPRDWNVCWFTNDLVTPVSESVVDAVQSVVNLLGESGARIVEGLPPQFERATELWIKLFAGPAANYVNKLYQNRIDEAGEFVRHVLKSHQERHAPTVAEQYAAKTELEDVRSELLRFLLRFDLLVAPVGSVNAFPHNSRKLSVGNSTVGVFKAFGYSQAANVFGLPSIALPVGRDSSGLPVGVQLIGSPFSDLRLLTVAEFVERELGGFVPVLS